jgi:hypothetical protein
MTNSTSLSWLRRLLVLGVVVAGVTASTAGAVGRPPDVQDTATAVLAGQISPPDVRDAALATTTVPDAFERYAAAHPYGLDPSLGTAARSRPPDVADAALAVQYGPSELTSSGFHWDDWAIGIGSGMGLALLLGGFFLMSRQLRHRIQTA